MLRILHLSFNKKAGNYGDYVLTYSVRKTFEKFLKYDIDWISINIKKYREIELERILQINDVDVILVGGGGLFMAHGNSDNDISGWQWEISNELLDKIDIPIILYTIGFNYFPGQEPNKIFIDSLPHLISNVDFFSLRHKQDVINLKKYIPNNNDTNISYIPCTTTILSELWELPFNKLSTKKIAVNIPFDKKHMRYGDNIDKKMGHLVKGIRELSNRGYNITVVFHVPVFDSEALNFFVQLGIPHTIVDIRAFSLIESFEFYQSFDLVISGRGHGQMIPFGLGVPILSINAHGKIKFFLEEIDHLDWLIDLDDIEEIESSIINKACYLLENKNIIQDEIENSKKNLYSIIDNNMKKIKGLLDEL